MKKITILLLCIFSLAKLNAQEAEKDTTYWKTGGLSSLSVGQVSLYQWAAGGENSVSGAALLNLYANYKKGNASWINSLDMGYGLIRQGDLTKKSDDRIELTSQYGRKASEKWFYSGMFNFKTQFTDGFKYPDPEVISKFMAPGYITTSLGMDYKPSDNFQVFLSPLTGKLTFVMDDTLSAAGAFGVEPGDNFRAELGGYAKIAYSTSLVENVDMKTKLEMFLNYMETEEIKDLDLNWEILLSMKINEFLSATLFTNIIWDNDINQVKVDGEENKAGIQAKVVSGIGFSYKF